jgi:Sulfotransferase domain
MRVASSKNQQVQASLILSVIVVVAWYTYGVVNIELSLRKTSYHDSFAASANATSTDRVYIILPDDGDRRGALKKAFDAKTLLHHLNLTLERAKTNPLNYDLLEYHNHAALQTLDPSYRPRDEWKVDLFPNIIVAGMPKAGTSQLYDILISHNRTRAFHRGKEFCFVSKDRLESIDGWDAVAGVALHKNKPPTKTELEVQHTMHSAFKRQEQINDDFSLTVNACIYLSLLSMAYEYLRPVNSRYIMILRDPADWLWSAYNFWTVGDADFVHPKMKAWTVVDTHYRTPELFHELVASMDKLKLFDVFLGSRVTYGTDDPWMLPKMVGRENVLYLKNEDMLPLEVAHPGGVLDKLSAFLGLERLGFPEAAYATMHNCNGAKGEKTACDSTTKSSAYAITGGREMLPETRTLIYLQFWEECKLWAREFGVEYPDCLNIVDAVSALLL